MKLATSGLVVCANTGDGIKKHKNVNAIAYTIFRIVVLHILTISQITGWLQRHQWLSQR